MGQVAFDFVKEMKGVSRTSISNKVYTKRISFSLWMFQTYRNSRIEPFDSCTGRLISSSRVSICFIRFLRRRMQGGNPSTIGAMLPCWWIGHWWVSPHRRSQVQDRSLRWCIVPCRLRNKFGRVRRITIGASGLSCRFLELLMR